MHYLWIVQLFSSFKISFLLKFQEDAFKVSAKELGKLVKLRVRHDNKGIGAAWFLDRIEIEDTRNKKTWVLPWQSYIVDISTMVTWVIFLI